MVSITENLLGEFDSLAIIKKIIAYLARGGWKKGSFTRWAPLNEKFKKLKNNLEKANSLIFDFS